MTITIPVYRRLDYLPTALGCVERQDYPNIELIVSDNGDNGDVVPELVAKHYSRPFTFRRNPVSVPVVEHFNQLLDAATMPYVTLLCDDDEISPGFVSELVELLERHPRANVALPRPELLQNGRSEPLAGWWPKGVLTGEAFLRAYTARELRLASTVTHVARTTRVRECGKYAALPRALYSDNLLLTKLALTGDVAFGQRATFRWRVDDASTGFSASQEEVAGACRGFIRALDRDAQLKAYGREHPVEWRSLKRQLASHCARWYCYRWRRYSTKLPRVQWVTAAFAMPYIPSYYGRVRTILAEAIRSWARTQWPSLHRAYRTVYRRGGQAEANGR